MTWLREKLILITGAIFALVIIFRAGRRAGKNAEKIEEKEKILKKAIISRRIDNLSNDDIDRLPSKYD